MKFNLDVNQLFKDATDAISKGHVSIFVVFALVALILSPFWIPAISKAVAEQRKLSHQREANLLKIRNSIKDRGGRGGKPGGPRTRS